MSDERTVENLLRDERTSLALAQPFRTDPASNIAWRCHPVLTRARQRAQRDWRESDERRFG